jgi:hypothetical protein
MHRVAAVGGAGVLLSAATIVAATVGAGPTSHVADPVIRTLPPVTASQSLLAPLPMSPDTPDSPAPTGSVVTTTARSTASTTTAITATVTQTVTQAGRVIAVPPPSTAAPKQSSSPPARQSPAKPSSAPPKSSAAPPRSSAPPPPPPQQVATVPPGPVPVSHADATGVMTGEGGLCVDDQWSVTNNYNPIQMWGCDNTNAQSWTWVEAGSTLHVFGKCLDIDGSNAADGTMVDLYDCNGTGAQVWIPRSDGSLYNPATDKCLDDPNGSTSDGAKLQIWDCNGGDNQKWRLP